MDVVIKESGMPFHSVDDCARYLGVTNADIYDAIITKKPVYGSGFHIEQVKERSEIGANKWRIINEDTLEVYKNGAECARKLGVSRQMVYMTLSGKRPTCKGFRLRRAMVK